MTAKVFYMNEVDALLVTNIEIDKDQTKSATSERLKSLWIICDTKIGEKKVSGEMWKENKVEKEEQGMKDGADDNGDKECCKGWYKLCS